MYQVGDIRAFSDARNLKGEDGQRHTAFWEIRVTNLVRSFMLS